MSESVVKTYEQGVLDERKRVIKLCRSKAAFHKARAIGDAWEMGSGLALLDLAKELEKC